MFPVSECPSEQTNLLGRVGEYQAGAVSRWEDCGRRCGEKASCQFWVWSSPRAGRPGTCALLDGFGTKIFDPKAVAGRWDCKHQSRVRAGYTVTQLQGYF